VVVTDGFTGNVALKTGEGVARFFAASLRETLTSSLSAKAGAVLASGALKKLRARLEPPGGGPFLGLNGTVVKSHGGADARSFADAVKMAADLAASGYAAQTALNLERLGAALDAAKAAAEAS
jgi:glycerol-3-phosphate acyltransferase PlsX